MLGFEQCKIIGKLEKIMRTLHFSLFVLSLIIFTLPAYAAIDIDTPASNAVIMDAATGEILMAKKPHEHMPTSSMSKTMTVYAVFKALEEGRIKLTDTLPVSEKAWRKGGSKMFVEVNSDVSVEDLLKGIIVQSGNDATIVVAEGLAGSEDNFARSITQMAKDLGMNDTNFMNASGWPDPEHYSSAYDLAILARHLINDFPQYYEYFSMEEFTYNDIKQPNRNPLLYRNMGVDGLKTGHTEAGGYGLMASAIRDDRRLIMVVNGLKSSKMRASESARLLEWGFNSFDKLSLFKKGDEVSKIDVLYGESKTVPVTVENDISVNLYKPRKSELDVVVEYNDPLYAPIEQGQKVGVLKVSAPGIDTQTYDLVAKTAVEDLGIFPKVMTKLTYMVLGKH